MMKKTTTTLKRFVWVLKKRQRDTYHHANVSFVITIDFNGVIHNKIHELVKPTESSNYRSVGIKLNYIPTRKKQKMRQELTSLKSKST